MKKVKQLGLLAMLILAANVFQSCIGGKYFITTVKLDQVESPENAKEQFGETKIVEVENGYKYEDDLINIIWKVSRKEFKFDITNKTNHSMKINWDDISYVDINGRVGRVMHSGVKYNEKNNSQPPTTIPRGASLSDLLLPTDNVSFVSTRDGGYWSEEVLVNPSSAEDIPLYIGKTMQIAMPISIENVQNDYIFIFKITNIEEHQY